MSDLIDRQAALQAMDTWDKFGCDPDGKLVRYDDDKHYVPYVHYEDMVHAIKHLPSAQPECKRECTPMYADVSDCISRQAAINAPVRMVSEGIEWIPVYHVEQLPSAQPEEDCNTCKHGYFGDTCCNNCMVRFPNHYERRTDALN